MGEGGGRWGKGEWEGEKGIGRGKGGGGGGEVGGEGKGEGKGIGQVLGKRNGNQSRNRNSKGNKLSTRFLCYLSHSKSQILYAEVGNITSKCNGITSYRLLHVLRAIASSSDNSSNFGSAKFKTQ